MTDAIGPKNEQERLIFAIEGLRADVQLTIQEVMFAKGISRSDLAKALGCSPANVTQLLAEDGNPTIETIARVLYALGDVGKFQSRFLAEHAAATAGWAHSGAQRAGGWRIKGRSAVSKRTHRQATAQEVIRLARDAVDSHMADAHNRNVVPLDRYRPAA